MTCWDAHTGPALGGAHEAADVGVVLADETTDMIGRITLLMQE